MSTELADAHTRSWAFYGATGVTGCMILERALARGHRPTLIGRDQRKLDAAAAPHGLKTIRAELDEPETLARVLAGHRLVLNAAGPFRLTAGPLSDAAMAAGIDYLDLNGELLVLHRLLNQHARALDRGVALVGGAGFGIAAADGLIAQVVGRLGGIDALRGEGFATAADTALGAVEAALIARPKPGAHTPATAFGPESIAGILGTVIRIAFSTLPDFGTEPSAGTGY